MNKDLEKIYKNYCKVQWEFLIKTKVPFDPKEFDDNFINLWGNNINFSWDEVQRFIDEENKKANDLWENS